MSCCHRFTGYVKRHWAIVVISSAFVHFMFFTGLLYNYNLLHIQLKSYFNSTATQAGIPGALSIATNRCSSVIVTAIFQTVGHRKAVVLGVTICCLGLLISSFAQNIVVLYISYGVLFGFGHSTNHLTIVDVILRNCDERNASRATCFAFCGVSVGLLISPCFDWLYVTYSWRVALRILCVIFAFVGYTSALVMVEVKETDERKHNNEDYDAQTQFELHANKEETQYELHANKEETQYELHANEEETQYELHKNKEETQYELHANKKETQYELHANEEETQYELHANEEETQYEFHANEEETDIEHEKPIENKAMLYKDDANKTAREQLQMSVLQRYRNVFRRPGFVIALMGFILSSTAVSFTFISVGSYLSDTGMDMSSISRAIVWMGVSDLLTRILAAFFSDRLPISRTTQFGIVALGAAVPSVFIPFIASDNGQIATMIGISVPRSFIVIMLPSIGMELSSNQVRAEAVAVVYLLFGLGALLTPFVTDTVYDVFGSYDIAWFICAGLYVATAMFIFVAAWLNKKRMQPSIRNYNLKKESLKL